MLSIWASSGIYEYYIRFSILEERVFIQDSNMDSLEVKVMGFWRAAYEEDAICVLDSSLLILPTIFTYNMLHCL